MSNKPPGGSGGKMPERRKMAPASEIYMTNTEYNRPERRGVSRRAVIGAAKEKIETIDFANLLCGPGKLRSSGATYIARCPLPDHQDRTPSFTVYPETNSWFCYGCLRGGDVIELARFAWGYSKEEAAVAAAYLLLEFGHDVPPRPESWYRKQARQRPVRDALDEIRISSLQRRLFRLLYDNWLADIQDPKEQKAEAETIRRKLAIVTRKMYFDNRAAR